MMKLAGILALCWACVGCETGPTQPRRALSPIEACFSEALSNSRSCALMAAGSGMRIGDATANRNMQICDEKKRNHEIYCVQMYGQPQQRQNITTPPASSATVIQQQSLPQQPMGQQMNKCQQDGGSLNCLNRPSGPQMPRQGMTPYQ